MKRRKRRGRHVGIGGRAFGQIADVALGRDRIGDDVGAADDRRAADVGARKPVIIFMVVDLPAPLGPRKPSTSPRCDRE